MKRKTQEWEETAHYKSQERHADNTQTHTLGQPEEGLNRPKRRDGPMTQKHNIKTQNNKKIIIIIITMTYLRVIFGNGIGTSYQSVGRSQPLGACYGGP